MVKLITHPLILITNDCRQTRQPVRHPQRQAQLRLLLLLRFLQAVPSLSIDSVDVLRPVRLATRHRQTSAQQLPIRAINITTTTTTSTRTAVAAAASVAADTRCSRLIITVHFITGIVRPGQRESTVGRAVPSSISTHSSNNSSNSYNGNSSCCFSINVFLGQPTPPPLPPRTTITREMVVSAIHCSAAMKVLICCPSTFTISSNSTSTTAAFINTNTTFTIVQRATPRRHTSEIRHPFSRQRQRRRRIDPLTAEVRH